MSLYESFHHAMNQLGDWARSPRLAVACSGGADSLALTLLVQEWTATKGGTVTALIVDHGLRPESASEAQQVADWLQAHQITHDILPLDLPVETAIQETARNARYQALEHWCNQHGVQYLLTGHHADDQIETFLFRLLRGSGPDGLAGMSAKRALSSVQLLRPLLWASRSDCEEYLLDRQQDWVHDPSNENPQFSRTRIRKWIGQNLSEQHRHRLINVIDRFGHNRARDDVLFQQVVSHYATVDEAGVGWFMPSNEPMASAAVLKRLLITVHGNASMPRQQEVEQLYADMMNDSTKTRSLHHCLIIPHESRWLVIREPARRAGVLPILPNTTLHWDNRFEVQAGADLPADCQIGALGEAGYRWMKEHHPILANTPRTAIESFPAIWRLEQPVFVPHIGYNSESWPRNACTIRFSPVKALAEPPFFTMNKPSE